MTLKSNFMFFFSTCEILGLPSVIFCLSFTLCHTGKQLYVDKEKSRNTDWGSVVGCGMTEQRLTRKATYRLEVAEAIKGQSEGTGARRDTAEDEKSKRKTKKGRQ